MEPLALRVAKKLKEHVRDVLEGVVGKLLGWAS